jgi:hypothetical protein
MDKIVAIHQPNFFPWLGFFNKIVRSDIFVLLDNVQFPKTGGTWTNRVKLIIGGEGNWLTVPVVRNYHGVRLTNEIEINGETPWRDNMIRTIQTNYRRALQYKIIFPILVDLIKYKTSNLCDFNINALMKILQLLQVDTSKIIRASTLKVSGKSTERLISIVKAVGGNTYMCGGGALGYQEDDKFKEAGTNLIYQNFNHPKYTQHNSREFVPGLSIIDALMNLDIASVATISK